MSEQYKTQLATKTNTKEPSGQRVWFATFMFAILSAMSASLATYFGTPVVTISLIGAGIAFIWLILELLKVTMKSIFLKLVRVIGFFIGLGLIWSLIFGMINTVANGSEIVMWTAILAVTPCIVVLFFRYMDGRKVFEKIHRKIYFELLITIFAGAVLTYFPNAIVLRTLFATRLIQFLLLLIINIGLITRIIITCRNRGVL